MKNKEKRVMTSAAKALESLEFQSPSEENLNSLIDKLVLANDPDLCIKVSDKYPHPKIEEICDATEHVLRSFILVA